jgi:signal transduction histidine kinase
MKIHPGILTFIACSIAVSVMAQDIECSPIHALLSTPRVEAAKRPSVRVRGVVSVLGEGLAEVGKKIVKNKEQALSSFCMEDDSGGIWISVEQALRDGIWTQSKSLLLSLKEGSEIEMDGVLDEGAFAPVILPASLRILGQQALPQAPEVPLSKLLNGAADLKRVQVSGVVQSIADEMGRRWLLKIETGLGHFLARLPKTAEFEPSRLLDAEVRMNGVAAVSRNWRSEFVCPRLIISREEDVIILKQAPDDPFAVQKVPLDALDAFSPQGRPLHRRCIEGVVTYSEAGKFLFMQSGSRAIRVETVHAESLVIGDLIEATGFIDTGHDVAGLSGALIRKLSTGVTPTAVPMSLSLIRADFAKMRERQKPKLLGCDGLLVSVQGLLLNVQSTTSDGVQRLELDCGDGVTTLFARGISDDLKPGTELRATGIAHLQYAPMGQTANFAEPMRLDVLLRDRADITLLKIPSWWTPQRTLFALCGVAVLAFVALVWVALLRRTVASQTLLLAQEMRGRRDAAVEFQAALRERSRLAANLHDTVLQTMTGIAYQIEACEAESIPETERSANHLEIARRMVQRGQEDLRNSVWALKALPMKERTFAEAVRSVAKQVSAGHEVEIIVDSINELPTLADFIAGNLLLIIQEAVHNALKHAKPTQIRVTLSVSSGVETFVIEVKDDGHGFELGSQPGSSSGHFGLNGMTERAERLGGTLELKSTLGRGTTLFVQVPLRSFDHDLV